MIIEKSRNYALVVGDVKVAELRLKGDISADLAKSGIEPTRENINLIYEGFPTEVRNQLLSERL